MTRDRGIFLDLLLCLKFNQWAYCFAMKCWCYILAFGLGINLCSIFANALGDIELAIVYAENAESSIKGLNPIE